MGSEGSKSESNKKSSSIGVGVGGGLAGAVVGAGLMYLAVKAFGQNDSPKPEEDNKDKKENEDKKSENESQITQHKLKTGSGDEIPESFICPISGEIMKDPVITPSGISYERETIETWLKKKPVDPLSKKPLDVKDLIPNRSLKDTIQEFMNKCK